MTDHQPSLTETIYHTLIARQAPIDTPPATDISFPLQTTLLTTPSPTPTLSPTFLSSLNGSSSSHNATTTSSHIYHPVKVGTVLNPTEVPAKWAPKDIDIEHKQRVWFLWGVLYFWAGTFLIIWAMGWYESFWYIPFIWEWRHKRQLRKTIREILERGWETEYPPRHRTEKEKREIVERMMNLERFKGGEE